jgi:DNA-binding PucR family transcriptional regulator
MKAHNNEDEAFEERARDLLEESTNRLDGNVRSRLTQARFAAVEEARRARHSFRWRAWIPAGALAAAAAVAIVLWSGQSPSPAVQSSLDDLEIVADGENFELLENLDFYEWVSTQDPTDIG